MLSVGSSNLTLWAQNGTGTLSSLEALPLEFRLSNAVVSYARYLGKMIWPTKLAVVYPLSNSWTIEVVTGAAILLIALTGFALSHAQHMPQVAVGWFGFLITLVPVIGIIQVGRQAMADRYTYLPLVGLFIALVWFVSNWVGQQPSAKGWVSVAGVG